MSKLRQVGVIWLLLCGVAVQAQPNSAHVQRVAHPRVFLPEQRTIQVRPASHFARGMPETPPPPTVSRPQPDSAELPLTLDQAINIALENSEVIRILGGLSASSSGRTIYDVAITNTTIDEQRAAFDPFAQWQNSFNRFEPASAVFDPADPNFARIDGTRTDDFNSSADISKTTQTGGTAVFGVNTNPSRFRPGTFALNPQNRHSLDLSFTQPLYRGGGIGANRAPIVIARIDTERSFFQYKDSVQELVRGVVAGYWALVFARTDEWARRQQVKQAEFAYEKAKGEFEAERASIAVRAQARVSLGNFRTSLLAARNNVLQREAALRNVLGIPPADGRRLIPVTPPTDERVEFDWPELLALAEQNRPDLIELKLIIEADEQQVLLARNQARPTIDATALYRWNGISGRTPTGASIASSGGQFADWSLGVNFSVPLSLRRERAALRRQELIVARDRAHLRQGIHNTTHILATNLRNLDQTHEQYREFHEIRGEANVNVQERLARWENAQGFGNTQYVEVLLAITDWGNTISAEARSLTQYNIELANIERETGTILESHGVRFLEERFGAIGPLGRHGPVRCYPRATPAVPNTERYQNINEPAENFFELSDPLATQ